MYSAMNLFYFASFVLPAAATLPYISIQQDNTTFQCPTTTCPQADITHVRAAMQTFADDFYAKKDVPGAFNTFVAENYIQHNAGILSGRQNAIQALEPLFASSANTFDVRRITVGQDDSNNTMVIIHLEASNTSGNQTSKTDVVDMYRVIGTCIVEHWDVLQQESSTAINPLAYF